MSERPDHRRVPRLFANARIHLSRAVEQRRECIRLWDEIRQHGLFTAWLEKSSEDTAELWCACRPTAMQLRTIDEAAGKLLAEIKSSMDAAVLAAAIANVGLGNLVADKHSIPLCFDASEFDELPYEGWLMGLRPDQVNMVREVQPFAEDRFLGVHMRHFALVSCF